jgi:AcrR family transcriptional regulator
MSRVQALTDHFAKQRLIDAALARFDQDGYQATSIRQIAADVGCSVAAFYAHFTSKQALLVEILDGIYTAAIAEVETAVALAGDDPAGRLEAAVWAQCELQMRRRRACRVAQAELANLGLDDRARLLQKRMRLTQILHGIIVEGAAVGVFDTSEPEATTRALATICDAVGLREDGGAQRAARQIAQTHCELAARLTGAVPERSRSVGVPASVQQRRTA